MAGNQNKRDENYEIKYLRKTLALVDDRVRVPQSLDASSLRPLIEDIEPTTLGEAVLRRPRWLSLQSGIAYAAAFALIVALFYSMEIYKPDMIDGGMRIAQSQESPQAMMLADIPEEGNLEEQPEAAAFSLDAGDTLVMKEPEQSVQPRSALAEEPKAKQPAVAQAGGVGGGGRSALLVEQGGYEYRWRVNDANDPDRTGIVTFEVIEKDSQEFAAQIDINDMTDIEHCFAYEEMLMLVGTSDNGIAMQVYYDPENPVEQISLSQTGKLIDVRLYKDIVHIVSLSDKIPDGAAVVALPHTESTQACIVTAVNLSTLETSRKVFTGAEGTVQLHNLNAYIRYEGHADDGSPRDYIGQILLDGMNIELGTVS